MLKRMFNNLLMTFLVAPRPKSIIKAYLKRLERLRGKLENHADTDKIAAIDAVIARAKKYIAE